MNTHANGYNVLSQESVSLTVVKAFLRVGLFYIHRVVTFVRRRCAVVAVRREQSLRTGSSKDSKQNSLRNDIYQRLRGWNLRRLLTCQKPR